LKSLADAIAARDRLLGAFEQAEMQSSPAQRAALMTVVVVGGGPTGVATTSSISEMVQRILLGNYRNIDLRDARIVLVEAGPRLHSPNDTPLMPPRRWSVPELRSGLASQSRMSMAQASRSGANG
jgi:NADH dehydrogenase FAD-containing subunit